MNLFLLWDLINCLVTVNSVINGSFICVTNLRDTGYKWVYNETDFGIGILFAKRMLMFILDLDLLISITIRQNNARMKV